MLDVPTAAEELGLGVPARGRSIDELPRDGLKDQLIA
jgi:hypothetical protein